jgi:SpoU rRNA methylase family enzyme
MEDWKPISRSAFESLVKQEISDFDSTDKELWSKYQVELRTAPILRSPQSGIEQVFVVAAIGERILFFDDVEDEFGVARPPTVGALVDYGTYGELRHALSGLAQYAA